MFNNPIPFSTIVPFSKYSGCGNHFILLDNRNLNLPQSPSFIQRICCRKAGVDADGVVFLEPSLLADHKMRIFNSDGSEAEMCGNGLRCLARFIENIGYLKKKFVIETLRGNLEVQIKQDAVIAEMPRIQKIRWNLILEKKWHLHFLDTGVPHVVLFVDDLQSAGIMTLGREIRMHSFFRPKGANVNFAKLLPDGTVQIRTYERGVEAETGACGTGAAAAALAAAYQFDIQSPISIFPRSEEKMMIFFERSENEFHRVSMEGPAHLIKEEAFELEKFIET